LSLIQKKVSIGIDVGGSHITTAGVDETDMHVIEGSKTRRSFDHSLDAESILKIWAEAIESTIHKLGEDFLLSGMGFAIPGPFDYKKGICQMDQKMVSLKGKHIPNELNKILQVERDFKMRFLNDATCFAIGESIAGMGVGKSKVVVITLGTGFGSAFLDQNIPIVKRYDVPKEGCLWHLPFGNSIADDYFGSKWFVNFFAENYSEKVDGVREILEKGETLKIENVFSKFASNLSDFLGPYLKEFEADILIVGGNISKALPYFKNKLISLLHSQGIEIEIKASELLEEAAIVGASKLLDDDYWAEIYQTIPNI